MQFAAPSVPKTTPLAGEDAKDGGGLHFCSVEEGVARFRGRTAGKLLLVSDARSYARLAFASSSPRALSVVLDGADVLPLFAMPDGVGAIFAAGGEETLTAARFFAEVRRVPCALAPSDAALYGAYPPSGTVLSDGVRMQAPLRDAELFCDVAFMRPSLSSALARVGLARLARFEARALAVFAEERPPLKDAPLPSAEPENIVRANSVLRQSERQGAWQGEGASLVRLYPEPDVFRALHELTALYLAFFKCGKPRKYAVADYSGRARRAGSAYGDIAIPSPDAYARRALMLERRRADFLLELNAIARQNAEIDSVYAFSQPITVYNGISDALYTLPERCPGGLSAVIRDFGLLERS